MPLSSSISTGLVKGRFGSGVVKGPNGEKLLIPARGRIDFEGMTPFSSFPLATPDPITMLRPKGSGILDGEGYLCAPDPADRDKPGERMVLLQAPNGPDSTVQGWTWRATLRFVNADGTRVRNTLDTITFDLPFGDVPFDLAQGVSVPESPGIGKEQVIIYAASAQAAAVSAADDAEAARKDADAAAAAAVSAASGVEGARADAESARVEADRAVDLIATADGSAGAAASSADRAEREAEAAKVAAGTAATAAGRSADESAAARSAAGTAVAASTEAVSTANTAKSIATGVETRANAGEFKGLKGDTGPANKLAIGTVAKADTAAATITGTAPNQTLNLQLPKGDVGPAVTLSIGSVASGATAAASLTGTGPAQALNLTLPRGDTGNGWNATPIGAPHLDTMLTPGTYQQSVPAYATIANGYPAVNLGTLNVEARLLSSQQYGPSVVQTYTPIIGTPAREGQIFYKRTNNGGAFAPWRVYAAQRVDNTAGRTIYTWDDTANREQLIYGDTGVRDISGLVDPKWTTTVAKIRRTNNTVELTVIASPGNNSGTVLFLPAQLPSGFRNAHTMNLLSLDVSGKVLDAQIDYAFLSMRFNGVVANNTVRAVLTWTTIDPWPTTLPGVASGAISNS